MYKDDKHLVDAGYTPNTAVTFFEGCDNRTRSSNEEIYSVRPQSDGKDLQRVHVEGRRYNVVVNAQKERISILGR